MNRSAEKKAVSQPFTSGIFCTNGGKSKRSIPPPAEVIPRAKLRRRVKNFDTAVMAGT
jgi:hypothetical protein